MSEFLKWEGEKIPADELKLAKAQELTQALANQNYVTLVECFREFDGSEAIVFDTVVEVPQRKVHDIRRLERIGVRFDPQDKILPETLALRDDFPHVPHLNIRSTEFPRSLCIFDVPYSEIKRHWTAAFYIRKVRDWLRLTARGELHGHDQPLEPLLYGSEGILVYPPAIFDQQNPAQVLIINEVIGNDNLKTYIAIPANSLSAQPGEIQALVTILFAEPQAHGIIRAKPKNIPELHTFLESDDLNLLDHLRQQLKHWKKDENFDAVKNAKLIILTCLPKSRYTHDDLAETVELKAFVIHDSIVEVGREIGIWEIIEGSNIGLLLEVDTTRNGENIQLEMLNPLQDFSKDYAAVLNGITYEKTDVRITAVGSGALGSQLFLNLWRMGYGRWIHIDDDILLPHNLARHELLECFVGKPKAWGLAVIANQMMGDFSVQHFVENVLFPSSPDALKEAFRDAQVILDMSASIEVARKLTYGIESDARRISLFLNPTATSLIILAEDAKRKTKLDTLEMQYYREVITNPELEEHLSRGEERVRYGTSCRDLSSKFPQDLVALHSAISSRALRQIISDPNAQAAIWSADPEEVTTQKYSVQSGIEKRITVGNWTIVTDSVFMERVSRLRESKLPNETGGILIGSHDIARKIVYVIDTIPAPPDSVEWPTVFIRGAKGLRKQIQKVQRITDNQLNYVGEWHSHPVGASAQPSNDDMKAFNWLADIMINDGLPPLMLIVADNQTKFYLGEMVRANI